MTSQGKKRVCFILPISFVLAGIATLPAQAQLPDIRPDSSVTIAPPLDNAKERNNLSGAACAGNGTCLLIGDEKRYARLFSMSGNTLAPRGRVFLLPETTAQGVENDETDGEGIAFDQGFFYVVGSHSRNKDGEDQPSRHFLYRVPLNAQTQGALDLGSAAAAWPAIQTATLDPFIRAREPLCDHMTEPPGETPQGQPSHGTNIEGIAVSDGTLFVGFRGPVHNDGAIILRMRASDVFAGRHPPECHTAPASEGSSNGAGVETHRVRLGPGQGIRDLAAVRGGFLILAGPETRLAPPDPQLFFWSPNSAPVPLGRLAAGSPSDSPESITVLAETGTAYRVLVLSDGDSGGLPIIVTVRKPSS